MKVAAVLGLALLAGCNHGLAVDVDLDRGCAPHLDVTVLLEPSGDTRTLADLGPDIQRMTVVPPDTTTSVIITATARDAYGIFASVSTSVDVRKGPDDYTAWIKISPYCNGDMPIHDGGMACARDDDCPPALVCSGQVCVPGCNAGHGCGSFGDCNVDAGACQACASDADCGPARPRCDTQSGTCQACLPTNDNCPNGERCAVVDNSWQCAASCAVKSDCTKSNPNADCCNGACLDVSSDLANCGGCGKACSTANLHAAMCVAGTCQGTCDTGYANCNKELRTDGCEVSLDSDGNCGSCGHACPMGTTCVAMQCAAPPDLAMSSAPDLAMSAPDLSVDDGLLPVPDGAMCFVAGTLVVTDRGLRPIETLAFGDGLPSGDTDGGFAAAALFETRVARTTSREVDGVLALDVDGQSIRVTENHPFWVVGRGFVHAGELRPGDALLRADGSEAHLRAVEARPGRVRVYNLEVAGTHTYFVSPLAILVHNKAQAR